HRLPAVFRKAAANQSPVQRGGDARKGIHQGSIEVEDQVAAHRGPIRGAAAELGKPPAVHGRASTRQRPRSASVVLKRTSRNFPITARLAGTWESRDIVRKEPPPASAIGSRSWSARRLPTGTPEPM